MMRVLDFTSVLYLGLHHARASLKPWRQLTTGRPAALQSPAAAEGVAQGLAALLGCEAATVAPSSLHLFWDVFDILAADPVAIYIDAGTYPTARWGIERVAGRGIATTTFLKHDPAALRAALARPASGPPLVVTDGLCPLTGRVAPLVEYADLVRRHRGLLLVDDTQGFGLMGRAPGPTRPYGVDGAGTPAWHGLAGSEIIIVNSLAKAFGAPLAVMGGCRAWIERFKTLSLTRVHCSPPSMAALRAAEAALAINAVDGAARRSCLIARVRSFRSGLSRAGLSAYGGLFPFQTLREVVGEAAVALHENLLRRGVRAVLHRKADAPDALISFVITTLHSAAMITDAVQILQSIIGPFRNTSPLTLIRERA